MLAFCALRISRAIDLGHQEQTPERIHPCGSLFCNTRTGRVRSSRMSRSFRLLFEKTGGGGIASVENYLEPALPLLFESFFNFFDFFVLCYPCFASAVSIPLLTALGSATCSS